MSAPHQQFALRMGHEFQNPELLERALTHRSHRHDRAPEAAALLADNEQLEFLGDAVLGFVVSEALVLGNPDATEGQLSRRKADLVNASYLHKRALELGIGEMLRLGRGEERSGGRQRRTLLADALEAVIAAIYLDAGVEAARRFIHEHVLGDQDLQGEPGIGEIENFKSVLQEQAQSRGLPLPRYSIVETRGPEHAKVFTVEVRIGDQFASRATGSSKKSASQRAAELLLKQLAATDWAAAGIHSTVDTGAIAIEQS